MAVTDLKPADFSPCHAAYARMVQGFDFYVQGMGLGEVAIWLRIGGGTGGGMQTMIGFGSPTEALAEAEKAINQQMQRLRVEIECRKLET